MVHAFTLQIPLEAPYRALVPDVASRYAELSGGSSTNAAALAAALASAIDRLASGAPPNSHVDMTFRSDASGVHVDLSRNGNREAVSVAMAS